MLIDFTANGLKSALSARESEYLYEKIKSKYDRIRYEHSLASQKYMSPEIQDDNEHIHRPHKSISKKSKVYLADDMMGSVRKFIEFYRTIANIILSFFFFFLF